MVDFTETEEEPEKKSSILCFSPKMAAMARAGLIGSWEPWAFLGLSLEASSPALSDQRQRADHKWSSQDMHGCPCKMLALRGKD